MAMRPGPRQPVGSAAWVAEERSSALQIACSEVEEFSFSARNEIDWLNEHMAEIFSENQINVAEIFKTPGKLRGRTPRTARKVNPGETRAPLSDIFSATPKGAPNPFAISNLKQALTPKLRIAEDRTASPAKSVAFQKPQQPEPVPVTDSGYHGSQNQDDVMDVDDPTEVMEFPLPPSPAKLPQVYVQKLSAIAQPATHPTPTQTRQSFEDTFQSAKEEQTKTTKVVSPQLTTKHAAIRSPSPVHEQSSPAKTSPARSSPQKSSPAKVAVPSATPATDVINSNIDMAVDEDEDHDEETRSPSDGSSPIRPIVRKSSLNFASLPAREPLASNKSLGARMSRTSHLEQTRTSYYNRPTGGKSLGHVRQQSDDDHDEMDVDDDVTIQNQEKRATTIAAHNKTYTQRLQDQISMLGKSQSNGPRPSKSIPNLAASQKDPIVSNPSAPEQRELSVEEQPLSSPKKDQAVATPGAFPEDDDDDDWIAPPTTTQKTLANASPRPAISKSYSTDVMEGLHGKDTVSGSDFVLPKQRQPDSRPQSPRRPPAIPDRTTSAPGHTKSSSVPAFPHYSNESDDDSASLRKAISVSNPTLATVAENSRPGTPKSPSRNFRDGPLKQVKNKLSSILKSSNRLLASSAAISAEGKFSLLSPSTTRLGVHPGASVESLQAGKDAESLYPDLTQQASVDTQNLAGPSSPSRPRKTRASAERERREQKQKDKETKEAQRLADQMDKLEKAREKEREKARVFSKEQERVAAMEKQMAAQKEQEKTAPSSPMKEAPKPTRTSPRKAKAQMEAEAKAAAEAQSAENEVEMVDAPSTMPPPSVPRSAAGTQGTKSRELKRPTKPSKEPLSKPKQAPTLIRVNTSSQHSGFHPSNSVLAATLQDTLSGPQHQLKSKASQQSLHAKPSLQSLKSSVSSSGRPKALEMAAKRKAEEEREAQRKREAKAEMERKRAAMQEEERRQDQQRRQEAERQRQKEREQAAMDAEAKKTAQRQAAIEKAKHTRAPPPAARSQPNGPPEYTAQQGSSRPPSRLQSTMHRPQEETSRPVNAVLSNTAAKSQSKRPFPQDGNDDGNARPAVARSGPSYQKEVKRMRMTDEFDEDDEMEIQSSHSIIKGPPVRPSGGLKKDMPNKSVYQSSYANPPQGATRDLFKATVTAQHNSQAKAAHPLDMAQVSKSAIPFAPNPSAVAAHKTPARPVGAALGKSAAKSAAKSSPRFQNGDAIELPEIQTDDEDDEDDAHIGVAPWADSPELRRALSRQETLDPLHIFGPPAPLNMEEVFNKSKDRWHKFRARTSSANWSGSDRLTEEDIRKDLAARDKMRREGGWSYELSREMI